MFIINGSKQRVRVTDFSQRCAGCGRLFYFSHDCERRWVSCPYCGKNN